MFANAPKSHIMYVSIKIICMDYSQKSLKTTALHHLGIYKQCHLHLDSSNVKLTNSLYTINTSLKLSDEKDLPCMTVSPSVGGYYMPSQYQWVNIHISKNIFWHECWTGLILASIKHRLCETMVTIQIERTRKITLPHLTNSCEPVLTPPGCNRLILVLN